MLIFGPRGSMDLFSKYLNFVQVYCIIAISIVLVGLGMIACGVMLGCYLVLVPAIVAAFLTLVLVIWVQIKERFDRFH